MPNQKMELLNKIGIWTACLSFGIGVFLLISYALTHYDAIPIVGLYYLIFATIFNLIIFFALIISALFVKENKIRYFKTAGLMLLNIPIATACFFIGISLVESF